MNKSITMLSGLAISFPIGVFRATVIPHTKTALPSPTIRAAEVVPCESRLLPLASYLAVSLETISGMPLVVAVSKRKNMLSAT